MYKLCIAEKPSVAAEIGRVIGAARRKDGCLEGNGYLVTWTLGHLVEFAKPEEYGYFSQNDIWRDKESALNELPIFPAEFKTRVIENKKKQFEIIRQLVNRDDVELIIDCGDMGPEGHYMQWLIRVQANCDKPVMRFCAASLTDEAIRNAMATLRPMDEFEKIIEGEFCKHKADWILDKSMSRCFSLKYNARIDVGRVMSPTLYFVVKRYLDVQNFKPQAYYQVKADLVEGFSVFLKFLSKKAADHIAVTIAANPQAIIKNIETKRRATDRPQLYDLTELQRDGNRVYNYSAADVLEAAQNLYEQKILSNPRTDSRYLTSDLKGALQQRILDIQTLVRYKDAAGRILKQQTGLNIDKKIIDNDKVTDHHALIVTEIIRDFDLSKLGEMERNILHLVISRMIAALSHMYIYEETTIEVSCRNGQYILTAEGKKPIQQGFRHIIEILMGSKANRAVPAETDEEQIFPNIKIGQTVHIANAVTVAKQTAPPKLHTEATLLTAMENAGTQIKNGAILKGKGFGAQATRAGIIKKLFDLGYMANKPDKKINYIEPTKLGINCIRVLPQELYSPKITADWEARIAAIAEGNGTSQQFMKDFKGFINCMLEHAINNCMLVHTKNTHVEGVNFSNKESIGICPFCGNGEVYSVKGKSQKTNNEVDIYYCSLKCGFSLYSDNNGFYNNTGRTLKKSQVVNLINNETIKAKTKYKDKFGNFELTIGEKGKAYVRFIDKQET